MVDATYTPAPRDARTHDPLLAARIRAASQRQGRFQLRSGKYSDTYFDKYRFEAEPKLLRDIAEALATLIPPDTQVLAGLEMGGIPIATVLSQVTGLPTAFLRKAPKAYGTCQYAEGTPLQGRRFVLIEDVVSSGGAITDALALLRHDGLDASVALCVIDRQTGAAEALAAHGVALRALLTAADLAGA